MITLYLQFPDNINSRLIDESFSKGKYVETVDCTHKDLKHFQDFLYRYFYKAKYYDGMPAGFFSTAKMLKFDTIQVTNVKYLKLRPIIDQTGTYIYDAFKVAAEFLKPLARNEFTISDTLSFPELLKNIENSDDYEDFSCDVSPYSRVSKKLLTTSCIRYMPKKLLNQCVRNRFLRNC